MDHTIEEIGWTSILYNTLRVDGSMMSVLNNIKYNKINRLTLGQFSKVLLAIDNAHTVPWTADRA